MSRVRLLLVCLAVAALVPAGAAVSAAAGGARPVKVSVADDYYGPAQLTIKKGKSVKWVWSAYNTDNHNVSLNQGPAGVKRGQFKSPSGTIGLHFEKKFTVPGKYKFVCTFHRTVMKMTVVVKK